MFFACARLGAIYLPLNWRLALPELDHVLEHAEPSSFAQFGAETLLHRMAYLVYAASESSMRQCDIPFQLPPEEEILPNSADRLTAWLKADGTHQAHAFEMVPPTSPLPLAGGTPG